MIKRYVIHMYKLMPFTAVSDEEAQEFYQAVCEQVADQDIHISMHGVVRDDMDDLLIPPDDSEVR